MYEIIDVVNKGIEYAYVNHPYECTHALRRTNTIPRVRCEKPFRAALYNLPRDKATVIHASFISYSTSLLVSFRVVSHFFPSLFLHLNAHLLDKTWQKCQQMTVSWFKRFAFRWEIKKHFFPTYLKIIVSIFLKKYQWRRRKVEIFNSKESYSLTVIRAITVNLIFKTNNM